MNMLPVEPRKLYQSLGEEAGLDGWYEYIAGSIGRIKKRLGGAMCQEVLGYVDDAMTEQKKTGNKELHKKWVAKLLSDYYDPMYNYQMDKNANTIVFQGDEDAILEYIAHLESKA